DSNGGTIVTTNYLDGRLYSKTGTGVVPEYHAYGVEPGSDGRTWEKIYLAPTGVLPLAGPRWKTTWKDWLGREVRTERPGFAGAAIGVEESLFNHTAGQNSTGHVYRSTKPGPSPGSALVTRFDYDALGRAFRSGLDLGDDGLVPASQDRLAETNEVLEIESGTGHFWMRSESYAFPFANSATPVVTSIVRKRLTGLSTGQVMETRTTDADGNVTIQSQTVNRTTKVTLMTTTRGGIATPRTEKFENGFLTEVTGHNGLWTRTEYDALHRSSKRIEQRNTNTTETSYVSGTRLVATVREKAQTASPITTAQYTYDLLGRQVSASNADNKDTYFSYNRRDQVIRQWGAATQPVAYAYNVFGEKAAMRTFRNPAQDFTTATWPLSDDGADPYNPDPTAWSSGDKTTWSFDPATGLLASKTDAANRTVTYTYNHALQLETRDWARRLNPNDPNSARVRTTYAYSSTTGEQTGIAYNDATPALGYTYNRLGQLLTVQDATSSGSSDLRDFSYDPAFPHRLVGETLTSFFSDRAISRLYESTGMPGRPRGFRLGPAVGSNAELEQTYGYAAGSGRLESLASGRDSNATSRTFRYGYETDSALLKTLWTDDNSFFVTRSFEPNRDLLTAIETKWGQGASTPLVKYAYSSNVLAQRENVEQSGDVFAGYYSTGTIHQVFSYNSRGELTAAPTREGTVASPGVSLSNRQHEFDYDLIGNRKWAGLTGNSGDRKNYAANALNQYLSRDNSSSPFTGTQAFAYDDDGNLLTDGLWNYTWDGEQRLVRMSSALPAGQGYTRLELNFKYDYLGRRVEKKVENLDGPTPNFTHRYVYDGWNLIAEYAYASGTLSLTRSYTWGLDLARSLADAGGVGALLQVVDHASGKAWHPAYDGNGNIAALVNGATGTVAAVYEYSPYGELLRNVAPDPAAAGQPFRFSTKFTDEETGLVYYGRRFYSPSQGRFLGRDPIGELGGLNLYGFCRNNSVNLWDLRGMKPVGNPGEIGATEEEIVASYDDGGVDVVVWTWTGEEWEPAAPVYRPATPNPPTDPGTA
ncbi:MAG: hypothetical protein FJ399_12265, partial [Verrucomicrobia bacterium]|nr:hypothetical protein [Verrucomicrobiota bacterium]